MHLTLPTLLFSLLPFALTAPEPVQMIEERHIIQLTKRQADIGQLIQLASLAGLTSIPTDPALLLSLGPLASSLAAALPTPSILTQLISAAPSDFVSNIVHDPSYAKSFQSAFSAGESPSWFQGLPTDVRSYLHTYSGGGFTGLAGVAGAVQSAGGDVSSAVSGGASMTDSAGSMVTDAASSGGSAASGTMMSGSESMMMGASSTAASGMSSAMSSGSEAASSMTASASGADAATSSMPGQAANSDSGSGSSSSSAGAGARPTGCVAAGVVGFVGALGVVAAL